MKKSKTIPKFKFPLLSYFSEVRTELKKVTWPTRQETLRWSILVIVVSVGVGLYLGGLDYVFVKVVSALINKQLSF